jgi:hypothetical protein
MDDHNGPALAYSSFGGDQISLLCLLTYKTEKMLSHLNDQVHNALAQGFGYYLFHKSFAYCETFASFPPTI